VLDLVVEEEEEEEELTGIVCAGATEGAFPALGIEVAADGRGREEMGGLLNLQGDALLHETTRTGYEYAVLKSTGLSTTKANVL
jgi:hypothetical protein